MKINELLNAPEKWTKGALAKDNEGQAVLPNDPRAESWCVLGALYKCGVRDKSVFRALVGEKLIAWNDHPDRTFKDVQRVISQLTSP